MLPFNSIDILPYICEHADVHSLGRLCCVNSTCHRYLMDNSASGHHWIRAGKEECGAEYWWDNEEQHGRYMAILHLCPWLSRPVRFPMNILKAYENLYSNVELLNAMVVDNEENTDTLFVLLVHVQDNEFVKGGQHVVYRNAREEAYDDLIYPHDASDFLFESDPVETDTLRELKNDEHFLSLAKRYGLGELMDLKFVHQNLFAAIFAEGRAWRYTTVLFMDAATRSVVHELKLLDCGPRCVVFKPAEMWYITSCGELVYHGPSADRALQPWMGDGRITRAFFHVMDHNVPGALSALKTLGGDVTKICLPKTGYTLFDIAAEQSGLDQGLSPDAQLLLSIEPRFAQNSIHMVRRAIRTMDWAALETMAETRPISVLDVINSLPLGASLQGVIQRMRGMGFIVTYRY